MGSPNHSYRQQEDALDGRLIARALCVVLATSAIMVAGAVVISTREEARWRPSRVFPEQQLGPRRVMARVHQDLFGNSGAGRRIAEAEREHLQQFRWLDDQHERLTIPLEEAMELYLARRAPSPGGP